MFAFRFNGFCTTVHTETVGGEKLQINENPHMHSNQNVFLLMDDHKLAQYDTKSEMLPIEVKMTRLETACLLEKANNSPAKRKKKVTQPRPYLTVSFSLSSSLLASMRRSSSL